jgi:hypothetical protein
MGFGTIFYIGVLMKVTHHLFSHKRPVLQIVISCKLQNSKNFVCLGQNRAKYYFYFTSAACLFVPKRWPCVRNMYAESRKNPSEAEVLVSAKVLTAITLMS